MRRHQSWKGEQLFLKTLLIYGLVMHHDVLFTGLFVNGQDLIQPIEANSSPPHITGIKGSSVWLHWNYTYLGDGTDGGVTSAYKEQVIGFNSTSDKNIQPLAKRISEKVPITLQSPIPAPFNGRIEVIPSNSTLVIHRLQYNDSFYQYASTVTLNLLIGGTTSPFTNYLKPVVSITINGIPEFNTMPPSTLEVSENSNLVMSIKMDGNPKPSADFKWTHLPTSSITNVPSVQLYTFVYSSTYSLNNIDGSYCGRILQTTLKNSIGSSSVKNTNVTVLLKLDQDFSLKSGKIGGDNCIEVKWSKVESGACFVKYDVAFKTSFGSYFHTKTGYNIAEIKICNVKNYANITDVQLTVSFNSTSINATAKVSETPITTPAPTTNSGASIGLIVGASFGGLVFLILVIVVVLYCVKRSKRSKSKSDSGGPDYPLQDQYESQYAMADEVGRKQPHDPTYADPKNTTLIYGKIGDKGGGDRQRQARREDTSDYADVKVDAMGYPAVGAMPTSYTDGYGEKSRSRGDSGRDSSRRVAPDRKVPPPYNDAGRDDGYPSNVPPVYAQGNKPRKYR